VQKLAFAFFIICAMAFLDLIGGLIELDTSSWSLPFVFPVMSFVASIPFWMKHLIASAGHT
jgi:hypothetical protein